jgi:cytoskeletal protein CcmA (bactofilin family)
MSTRSIRENAKHAWKEILGVVGMDPDAEKEDQKEAALTDAELEPAQDFEQTYTMHKDVKVYPVSVISDGMTVNGDAKVQGDLELRGAMKGNIKADGNVTITGKLLGDLDCTKDVILISAAVQGNISTSGVINLDKESTVVGDIRAKSVTIDGKVKGSLVLEDSACFQKDAVLIGDVTAGSISMSEGAQIIGSLQINTSQVPHIELTEHEDIEL